jgi:hypothetical protein
MHVEIYDLISWGIAMISIFGWYNERKKNSKDYMIVQGLMRSIGQQTTLYAHLNSQIDKGELQPSKDAMKLILNVAFSNTRATMQQILGIIKSLGVKKDVPFDIDEFLNANKTVSTSIKEP